jgi:uroporphyrin-III C-methyltransferase/precorrin-2 dehydrogenase/sirohydrochlorin ferrochelatase
MQYLPIFIDLKQQDCLVVGGGDIAARKSALLKQAQANITLVAPALAETTRAMVEKGEVTWVQAEFVNEHVQKQRLVVAATDDETVNTKVYEAAKAKEVLVNVADSPAQCDFILASILDRSPIVVAVSSGGDSPVLARNLRARLETLIPPSYSRLGELVGRYREAVKQKFKKIDHRRRFWDAMIEGPVGDNMLAGRDDLAERLL